MAAGRVTEIVIVKQTHPSPRTLQVAIVYGTLRKDAKSRKACR